MATTRTQPSDSRTQPSDPVQPVRVLEEYYTGPLGQWNYASPLHHTLSLKLVEDATGSLYLEGLHIIGDERKPFFIKVWPHPAASPATPTQ